MLPVLFPGLLASSADGGRSSANAGTVPVSRRFSAGSDVWERSLKATVGLACLPIEDRPQQRFFVCHEMRSAGY